MIIRRCLSRHIAQQTIYRPTKRRLSTAAMTDEERMEMDRSIKKYSQMPQKQVNLEDLVKFKLPLSDDILLKNASEALHDITIRLAHRLEALRNLDYLIVLNPYISQIYSLYYNSFRVMNTTEPPKSIGDNARFVQVLEHLVESHKNTIPTLAKGFYEARKYISTEKSTAILDNHLRARIGTRLIASHHIALTNPMGDNYIGTVQINCKPSQTLRECASLVADICDMRYGVIPHISIDQGEDIEFAYVPVHMEYIFTELLKNSYRAVIENHNSHIPILVTIVRTGQGVMIRIRDRGGGIPPVVESEIFGFSFSTYEEGEGHGFSTLNTPLGGGGSTIAGLGYGLPLSRAYAEFFGGKLQVQTYYGWGTDVYVTLRSPIHIELHK